MLNIRQKTILWLHTVLLALLPLSNIIGQWMTGYLQLPDLVLAWKEAAVVLICLLYILDIYGSSRSLQKKTKIPAFAAFYLYLAVLLLILISSLVNSVSLREIVLGFRVELFWVGFLALTIDWSRQLDRQTVQEWRQTLQNGLLIGFGLVSLIAVLSLLIGPQNFYPALGYSDGWGSRGELTINSPVCHSIAAEVDKCRLTAGFATPNNLAAYTLLVIPVLLVRLKKAYRALSDSNRNWIPVLVFSAATIWAVCMVYLTYSRSAWLAFVTCLVLGLIIFLETRVRANNLFAGSWNYVWRFLKTTLLVSPVIMLILFLEIAAHPNLLASLPPQIGRVGSSVGHYRQTLVASEVIAQQNYRLLLGGYGLSQSGPIAKPQYKDVASSRLAQENSEIAQKYQVPIWEMTVPENWYLQLILNGGLLYAVLYLFLIGQSLRYLLSLIRGGKPALFEPTVLSLGILCVFIVNLYLHVWENPVVAFYFAGMYLLLQLSLLDRKSSLTTTGKSPTFASE